jgi:hypothetical protein
MIFGGSWDVSGSLADLAKGGKIDQVCMHPPADRAAKRPPPAGDGRKNSQPWRSHSPGLPDGGAATVPGTGRY